MNKRKEEVKNNVINEGGKENKEEQKLMKLNG